MDAINLDDLIKSEEKIEPTVVGGAMVWSQYQ